MNESPLLIFDRVAAPTGPITLFAKFIIKLCQRSVCEIMCKIIPQGFTGAFDSTFLETCYTMLR
jgi:hypothetical protein